ncbi:MAG: MFS transporter [Bacteroidetes bacterium]|nr:MFS transporter [Bacteroidota bacterium]
MLRRFSLYGFLKNQQYFEPFILLAFLQMGLNYTLIGLLIAFRELMVNLLEIPSGAIADVWGRRRSMIVSFLSYIIHFVVIGGAGVAAMQGLISLKLLVPLLFASMIFYAVGDAFRTGTHKAMIFTWLRINGRMDEKTKVYGYTRSWSKIGSAVSVILACVFVFYTENYLYIFFFSIIPYGLNIINFTGYPKELDGEHAGSLHTGLVWQHLKDSFQIVLKRASLRRLILESMGFEGFFKSTKDYLQPILKQAALPVIALFFSGWVLTEEQQSVILIGPVYFFLFVMSAIASRKSHKLVKKHGDEDQAARRIWLYLLIIMAALIPSMYFKVYWAMIAGFILLYILQNLWRPVLISRFDEHSNEAQGATMLSVESQSKSIATMVIAPLLGAAIDLAQKHQVGIGEFWPIAVAGTLIAGVFYITANVVQNEQ